MTREEIEADIRLLANLWSTGGPTWHCEALSRAITRLRADLAKLDGPAEGFVRVKIAVSVSGDGAWAGHGGVNFDYADEKDMEEIFLRAEHLPGDRLSWVTADVPRPGSEPVIEGEVIR